MNNTALKVNVVRAYTFYDYPIYNKVSKCKKIVPPEQVAKPDSDDYDTASTGYFYGAQVGYLIENIDQDPITDIIIPEYTWNGQEFVGVEKKVNLNPNEFLLIPIRYLLLLLIENKIKLCNGELVPIVKSLEDCEDEALCYYWTFNLMELEDETYTIVQFAPIIKSNLFNRFIGFVEGTKIESLFFPPIDSNVKQLNIYKESEIVEPKFIKVFGNYNNWVKPNTNKTHLHDLLNKTHFPSLQFFSWLCTSKTVATKDTVYKYVLYNATCDINQKFDPSIYNLFSGSVIWLSNPYESLTAEKKERLWKDLLKVYNMRGVPYVYVHNNSYFTIREVFDEEKYIKNYYIPAKHRLEGLLESRLIPHVDVINNSSIELQSGIKEDIKIEEPLKYYHSIKIPSYKGKLIYLPEFQGSLEIDLDSNIKNHTGIEIIAPKAFLELSYGYEKDEVGFVDVKKIDTRLLAISISQSNVSIGELILNYDGIKNGNHLDYFYGLNIYRTFYSRSNFYKYAINKQTPPSSLFDVKPTKIELLRLPIKDILIPCQCTLYGRNRKDYVSCIINKVEGNVNQLCFSEPPITTIDKQIVKINNYTENKIVDFIKNKSFYLTKKGKERYGQKILEYGGKVTAKVEDCDYFVSDAVSKASTLAKDLNKIFLDDAQLQLYLSNFSQYDKYQRNHGKGEENG